PSREVVIRLVGHEGTLIKDVRLAGIVTNYEPDLRLPSARQCREIGNVQAAGPVASHRQAERLRPRAFDQLGHRIGNAASALSSASEGTEASHQSAARSSIVTESIDVDLVLSGRRQGDLKCQARTLVDARRACVAD